MLRQADDLLAQNEPEQALAVYGQVATHPDRDVVAAATYGAGNALYRIDRDEEALAAWSQVLTMGESPVTYRAWRQVAAARVRSGDLPGALQAYKEAEKRAPAADRAEIHSRLGWLSKETGNAGAAQRYFARSRGTGIANIMTYLIIGATVVTSLVAMTGTVVCAGQTLPPGFGGPLEIELQMDKVLVAQGQIWRLLTVVLVHDPSSLLHLGFNMYALWFAGQVVERMYGAKLLIFFYVLCGIAGSIGTYVFGDAQLGVGASGAIFGLFGVVLVGTRYHNAVLDAQSRAIASQIGVLIVLNLAAGFLGFFGNVDNFAHLGGLAAGAWLALAIPPGQVPTLSSFWQGVAAPTRNMALLRASVAILLLGGVLTAGYVVGTDKWKDMPDPFSSCQIFQSAPTGSQLEGVALRLDR